MTIYDTPFIRATDVATTDLMSIPEIPVYYPTFDEFKDFKKFIYKIEKRGAHHMGLCKVVPPKGWIARKSGYSDMDLLIIPNPITQSTFGSDGIYLQENKTERSVNYVTFRQFTYNDRKVGPKDCKPLEKEYWRTFHYSTPLYGANVSGTLTDESQKVWNIAFLPSILSDVLREKIGGVNTPYLYFGSWQSTFGWHIEDMDLYSINYLHFGMAKHWYVIPPPFARRFEDLAKKLFGSYHDKCPMFLRHKTVIINPEVLHKHGIPTRKILQEENEFMITFPFGYHSGFNTGLNIAESTNFASPRWIEFGKKAVPCRCFAGNVKINMEIFVKSYQPEKLEAWLDNKDDSAHPLDLYKKIFNKEKVTKTDAIYDMEFYKGQGDNYSSDEDTDVAYSDTVDKVTGLVKMDRRERHAEYMRNYRRQQRVRETAEETKERLALHAQQMRYRRQLRHEQESVEERQERLAAHAQKMRILREKFY